MTTQEHNRNISKSGTLFIISAPSGAGKTILVKTLAQTSPSIQVSVSHTTRPRRPDEQDGVAYHFIDEPTYHEMIRNNLFLEHAKVFDHYYGTSREWVKQHLVNGTNVILEIDWQGAQQVRSLMTGTVSVFILPPSYQSLKDRLQKRDGDNSVAIQRRMQEARRELAHYCEFDYIVINDEFDKAMEDLTAIIRTANLGRCRQSRYFDSLVNRMMAEDT
ncbi:MAG: guanylate kinase [Gammaproteobacteria bacterium RBG_16_51_14]|nr:MAG: guanylate kinase [Gammaproteobacteria bacterium RBG_16_51_14]